MKNPLRKLFYWFASKKYLVAKYSEMNDLLDKRLQQIELDLKPLEQNKIYVACVPGATSEELFMLKKHYVLASKKLPWTAPLIIFINKETRLLSTEELEELQKKVN